MMSDPDGVATEDPTMVVISNGPNGATLLIERSDGSVATIGPEAGLSPIGLAKLASERTGCAPKLSDWVRTSRGWETSGAREDREADYTVTMPAHFMTPGPAFATIAPRPYDYATADEVSLHGLRFQAGHTRHYDRGSFRPWGLAPRMDEGGYANGYAPCPRGCAARR